MKLDLILAEKWEQVNDAVKKKLNLPAPLQVRVFKDLSTGLFELIQGTAQFLTHKKSASFIKGQTPAFEFLLPFFYKEAYQVQQVSYLQLGELKAWVQALNVDTAFVAFAEDHPITGELYSFCDELDGFLNERRIYSIRVSHSRFRSEDLKVRPFSVRVCSWEKSLAVAVCGERFRSPVLVSPRQPWDEVEVLSSLETSLNLKTGDRHQLEQFEQDIKRAVPSAQIWFAEGASRSLDRSVLSFPDVSAELLLEKIWTSFNWSSREGNELVTTTNMCHWQALGLYKTWWEPLPTAELLRGMLILSHQTLAVKDFAKILVSSYEEIKALQNWS